MAPEIHYVRRMDDRTTQITRIELPDEPEKNTYETNVGDWEIDNSKVSTSGGQITVNNSDLIKGEVIVPLHFHYKKACMEGVSKISENEFVKVVVRDFLKLRKSK